MPRLREVPKSEADEKTEIVSAVVAASWSIMNLVLHANRHRGHDDPSLLQHSNDSLREQLGRCVDVIRARHAVIHDSIPPTLVAIASAVLEASGAPTPAEIVLAEKASRKGNFRFVSSNKYRDVLRNTLIETTTTETTRFDSRANAVDQIRQTSKKEYCPQKPLL